MTDYKPFLAIGAVLLIGAAVIAFAMYGGSDTPFKNTNSSATSRPNTATGNTQPATNPTPFIATPPQVTGNKDSKIVVEEFADYQCPACAIIHGVMDSIKKDYGDRVRFEFSNFPIVARHPYAIIAAQAAEAAGKQGKFWQMHDKIFLNQKEWGFIGADEKPAKTEAEARAIFDGYAKALGLNLDQLHSDMNSPEIKQRIESDQLRGQRAGVQGTPTIFMRSPLFATQQMLKPEIMAQPNGAGIRQAIEYMLNNGNVPAAPNANGK